MSFQFHTGSIKRYRKRYLKNLDFPRFNSILVRLKENVADIACAKPPRFNSILVRLKAERRFM